MLKSGGITFEPGLPLRHRSALDALDMGNLLKLWMRFPSVDWSFENPVQVFYDGGPFATVIDFDKSHGPPVLMGFAAGSDADELEKLGEEAAAKMFVSLLEDQIGLKLPDPTHCVMSGWRNDPLAGGAYMYPNPRFRVGDNIALREPIAGRIMLAGEALAEIYGYVDTAWSDGRRAAGLVIGA